MAEELYHNLTGDNESIHLKDWLPAGAVNEQVLKDMLLTRGFIENGLSKRMDTNDEFGSIKVRQPLALASYNLKHKLDDFYEQIMKEELNVKEVKQVYDLKGKIMGVEVDKTITPELKREGLMREVIRHVQSARKKAGLQVDDRIMLHLATNDEQLRQALTEYADTIASETLATMKQPGDALYQTTATVDGAELQVSLAKA